MENEVKQIITGSCKEDVPFHFIAAVPNRSATDGPAADLGHLVHLSFSNDSHQKAIDRLDTFYPQLVVRNDSAYGLQVCLLACDYLAGNKGYSLQFSCSPFVQAGTDFQKKVWRLIAAIPFGQTRTYGDLARMLGSLSSARAVGRACHTNPLALIIPCHRVVGATGIGGFAGGAALKRKLLAMESRGL